MNSLVPFIHFAGNCEEALNFYKTCFGGEISGIQRFSDSPMPVPEKHKSKIMYSEFKAGGLFFLASDGPPDYKPGQSDSVSLSIDFKDPKEEEKVFNSLSAGGKVTMPLADQFWGAKFGMLIDKYGFNWMLNCAIPNK
jgi:PhnB protein